MRTKRENAPPRRTRRTQRKNTYVARSFGCAVAVATASLIALGAASDINGRWVWRSPNGDGTFRETVFVLNADGSALSGSVIVPTSEQPIVDGVVEGASFHFATVTGSSANPRRTEYRGVLASHD